MHIPARIRIPIVPNFPGYFVIYLYSKIFPGGSDGKSVCLQHRRHGFSPWVGKIPWRRKWQPTPVLLPGKSHGWRSLVGYNPWGSLGAQLVKTLPVMWETWVQSLGWEDPVEKGKSLLQYSGLENSMDSIVYGVAKSQSQLSDFHFHFTPTEIHTYVLMYVYVCILTVKTIVISHSLTLCGCPFLMSLLLSNFFLNLCYF